MRRMLIVICMALLAIGGYGLYMVEKGPETARVTAGPVSSGVVGPPSLSGSFMDQVMEVYHSPAQGKGQTLYDLGVRYGVDPAWALAFFLHESTMGLYGWGASNHSLGNIRCTAGYVCNGGYRSYGTWEEGFEDWYRLITGPVYVGAGRTTVEQIIPVYAPAADHNNEWAYIHAVELSVSAWRSGRWVVPA